jgi:hypothetical protein
VMYWAKLINGNVERGVSGYGEWVAQTYRIGDSGFLVKIQWGRDGQGRGITWGFSKPYRAFGGDDAAAHKVSLGAVQRPAVVQKDA